MQDREGRSDVKSKGTRSKAPWIALAAALLIVLSASGYALARWLRPAWFREVRVPAARSAAIAIDGDTLYLGYDDYKSRDCDQPPCPLARLDAYSLDTGSKTTIAWTDDILDLVATSTHVVWRSVTCTEKGKCAGNFHAVPKAGGDVSLVAHKDGYPAKAGGDHVVWFEKSDHALRAWKVPDGTPYVLVQPTSWYFFVHEGQVFYSAVEDGLVLKVPIEGGPAVQVASGLVRPKWLAVSGKDIYVACASSPDRDESGVVMRVGLDGGSSQQLAVHEKEASGFLVADGFLYYEVTEYEHSPNNMDPTFQMPIFAQPLAGGAPRRFVGEGVNMDVLAHKGYLYVAAYGPVYRIPLASRGFGFD